MLKRDAALMSRIGIAARSGLVPGHVNVRHVQSYNPTRDTRPRSLAAFIGGSDE